MLFTSIRMGAGRSLKGKEYAMTDESFALPYVVPVYSTEECVLLYFGEATVMSKSSIGGAAESSDEILCFGRYRHLWWKDECLLPTQHFSISLLRCLRTKWWVACERNKQ